MFLSIGMVSCVSYSTGARRTDLFNRLSKTELTAVSNWKMGQDVLVLKRNHTFRYCVQPFGITAEYYTGTYQRSKDTIVLSFQKNRVPLDYEMGKQQLSLTVGAVVKPSFLAKSDTLIVVQKNARAVLMNSSGDYLAVLTRK